MTNAERLASIKVLVEAGFIKSHSDIYNYVPKTIFITLIGCNYQTFSRKIQRPQLFCFEDIMDLQELTGIDAITLCQLVLNDIIPPDRKHIIKK
jgi:hypothetical protein